MKPTDFSWTAGLADQQLKGWRRWWAERRLAHNPVAAVEYREQMRARQLLREFPPRKPDPPSADQFWMRVRADIQRASQAPARPVPSAHPLTQWWTEPVAVLTAVLVLLVVAASLLAPWYRSQVARRTVAVPPTAVQRVATTIPNTVASPFHVRETGVTCIWVSGLPWTPNMVEMQTLYANLDT